MRVLIVHNQLIPAFKYGGTERIIWWLGKELIKLGHHVTYLVKKGSECSFADVLEYNPDSDINSQIPEQTDIVHFHCIPARPVNKPYLVTIHGNGQPSEEFDKNAVFISRNHAERHNADVFVYNGLDPYEYGPVDFAPRRDHLLFLGRTKRKVKNLADCKLIAKQCNKKLVIIGGYGLSLDFRIRYKGFLGGEKKNKIINSSKALLFPVMWHEPFGVAVIESLYFGAPVIGTTYGSLPELVTPEVGFLSTSRSALIEAVRHLDDFDRKRCHEHVLEYFSAQRMATNYVELYEKVLNGKALNKQRPISSITAKTELLPLNA